MTGGGRVGRPSGQPKSGGRKAGTPNRSTWVIRETLERLGYDPIEGVAQIAMDSKQPAELRFLCHKEIASYVYPKRKPIDTPKEQEPERV